MIDKQGGPPKGQVKKGPLMENSSKFDRVQVRERNGIWEVKADGKFSGDYHQKELALAGAARLKLSLR